MLVYDNVGYVRIVCCESVNRLIQVCRTQYSCLDPIPMCMSGGVHVAMYYNRLPPIQNVLTSTQTQCSNVINVQFFINEDTGLYLL